MTKTGPELGAWAFLIGVILAVIFGFFSSSGSWLVWVLVIVGVIVGLLNITDKEAKPFLIAGVALVVVSFLGGSVLSPVQVGGISFLQNILGNLLILFVPATIIVALKSVFSIAKN